MGKKLIIKGADFSANGVVSDFTQIDYLSSNNKIARLLLSEELTNPRIIYKCKILGLTGEVQTVWGNSENVNKRIAATITSGAKYIAFSGAYQTYSAESPTVNVGNIITQENCGSKMFLNEKECALTGTPDFTANPLHHLILVGGITGTSTVYTPYTGFMEAIVYNNENNALIHHVIPVKKKNGVECLYDIVTQNYIDLVSWL